MAKVLRKDTQILITITPMVPDLSPHIKVVTMRNNLSIKSLCSCMVLLPLHTWEMCPITDPRLKDLLLNMHLVLHNIPNTSKWMSSGRDPRISTTVPIAHTPQLQVIRPRCIRDTILNGALLPLSNRRLNNRNNRLRW